MLIKMCHKKYGHHHISPEPPIQIPEKAFALRNQRSRPFKELPCPQSTFRVLHRWHRRNVGFAIASSQGDWERKQEKLQTKTRCLLSTPAPRPARRMFVWFFLFLLLLCSSFFGSCFCSLLAQALLLLIAPRFSSNFSFLAGSGAASRTFLRHPSFSVSSRPLAIVVSGAIPLAAAERVTPPCELRRAPAT